MALFRSESQEERSRAWLGRIVLARPVSFSILVGSALAFTIALAGFFILAEYTRKARVVGTLSPQDGVVRVVAPQAGRVEGLRVREGDRVDRNMPMLAIRDTRGTSTAVDAGAAIAMRMQAREASIAQQRALAVAAMHAETKAFAQRRSALQRELEQLEREIGQHERRAGLAREALARAEHLADIGFASAAARDRERDAALEAAARLDSMQRARLAFSRELATIEHEAAVARSRAQAQLASLDAQRAGLEQERLEREVQYRAAIVAPVEGVVASVLVEPGQAVAAGATLATVVASDAILEAHLFAPSRSIGFVRPGQEVLLRYLAYPHQKFGSHRARIVAVSRNPLAPGELGLSAGEAPREPMYRIKAALRSQSINAYGREEGLQPGMQVEADVLLDRRRLIEWIFEPLLSLAGRA